MIRHFFAVVIILIGLIGQYFFSHYKGSLIPYQFLWEIVSYGFIIGGALFMISSIKRKGNKEAKQYWKEINDLKANANQVKVNFSNCKVLHNSYLGEMDINSSGFAPADILAYKLFNGDSERQLNIGQSVVVYELSYGDETIKYNSLIIPCGKDILLLRLEAHKSTTLYIDKSDRSKYYFDMEFLYKQ